MSVLTVFEQVYSSFVLRTLVILFISWWASWLWSRRRLYALSYLLSGPMALPVLGNSIQMGFFGDHHGLICRMKNMKKKYGEIFRLWFGPELALVISEAEDFEAILMSKQTFCKGRKYDIFKTAINEGLLTASGPLWKRHRHILNPSFSLKTLRSYQKVHDTHAKHFVESMNNYCDKGIVDYSVLTRRFAADIICETLFEMPMEFYKGEKDHVVNLIITGTLIVHERTVKVWMLPEIIFKNSKLGSRFLECLKAYQNGYHIDVKNKIEELLEMKINEKEPVQKDSLGTYDESDDNQIYNERSGDKINKSSLSIMVDAMLAGNMTMQEILNEFDNILNPGLDTIYTQLSSFILLMGINKRCQDKLWREIKEVYQDDMSAEVETKHFSRLPYLDMVIREVIRHFPTGPIQMRNITEDFELKHRNMIIPPQTTLFLAPFLLHKNPKYWKDPEEFIPERFLPEESAKRPHFAFVPFSAGMRNCIGQVFGVDSIKTVIIYLMRNFEFHSDIKMADLIYKADISMRCGQGYLAQIKRRDTSAS